MQPNSLPNAAMSSKSGHKKEDTGSGAEASSLQDAERQPSVKRDDEENDQEGPKVNFDQDIDSLRKMFVTVISDYAVRQDTSIERLLFSRLGALCDFFGSKGTMDNIIPLLSTCSNRKESLVKLDCLKSVVGVGIKVGKQTLA